MSLIPFLPAETAPLIIALANISAAALLVVLVLRRSAQ
jgi:hypothetical protein